MEFTIETTQRQEIIDITSNIEKIIQNEIKRTKEEYSACMIFVPHATAGIVINENSDKRVSQDILNYLEKQIPRGRWEHDKIDNNADSHIKSSIIGPSEIIPLGNLGKLNLGTWQSIAFTEFDGPKKRKVFVKLLK